MRSLIWKRIQQGAKGDVNGFVILFIILWMPFTLKAALGSPDPPMDRGKERVYVQIVGDIESPGVYAFGQEPGLPELIRRAGGLKGGSALPRVFLGGTLHSGEKIRIRKDKERWRIDKEALSAFHKVTLRIPLSLNRESEEGLTAIPGIGPELAGRIVRKRDELGGFTHLNEIKTVYGIGDQKYQKIMGYLMLP